MKPISPHDPLDDLIAAALHGELTPEERTQLEARLQSDPAALEAYQEAQIMNNLLEENYKTAQPDPAFEQRMVSGVRRKIKDNDHRETAWESLLVLWGFIVRFLKAINRFFGKRHAWEYGAICSVVVIAGLGLMIHLGSQVKSVFTTISSQLSQAQSAGGEYNKKALYLTGASAAQADAAAAKAKDEVTRIPRIVTFAPTMMPSQTIVLNGGAAGTGSLSTALHGANTYTGGTTVNADGLSVDASAVNQNAKESQDDKERLADAQKQLELETHEHAQKEKALSLDRFTAAQASKDVATTDAPASTAMPMPAMPSLPPERKEPDAQKSLGIKSDGTQPPVATPADDAVDPSRKLIRNAQLELEVKSYQIAVDEISTLTRQAGGYVDTSSSQRGGNGKLQGVIVVKVLPPKFDAFLLQLRDLGLVQNQSVSTDDVTKEYFDTQARLENSRKMEVQLQDLLKRENGKVSDLLQVERELARVRGDIEQMQGQLKLYDFQVQYATITIQMREKDLNQTAAYILKENDNFSLFATDVESTFQKARHTAEDFKAQVLVATLNHNSGSDVSAQLILSVPPDQIDALLDQVRSLGRVADFTRETKRTAKDGGDSDQPADQTLTEKDKVLVNVSIRSDDETRKQVALTVVTKAVDEALDKAKSAALSFEGTGILSSSLNKTPQGQSTGQLSLRVPGKSYRELLTALRALGRTASFSLKRDDNAGPGANGDDAPVIISLALTDEEAPVQETQMSIALSTDVDAQAMQIKKDAAAAGVEVKASTFQRDPNGSELAQMTFQLPMSKYPAFIETLKKIGKVEALTVQRQDRPDQVADDSAPVMIGLQIHNQADIVPDNTGLWATLRQTFGDGAGALFGSVRTIGVILAFLAPWVIVGALVAWIGRRIYLWRKNK